MMKSVLGLDIGTTGCKALVVEENGDVAARAYREYPPFQVPRPGWLELDASCLWDAVQHVIRDVTDRCPNHHIASLCLSTMGDSFVPVNQKGKPLGNVILAADTRSVAETDWLVREIGRENLYRMTGMPADPISPLTKVLWLKQHAKERFEGTHKFLCCEEFIVARLGLPPTTSYANACRTLAFDIRNYRWSQEILGVAGVSETYFPQAVPSGTIVGEIPHTAASELGFPDGVKVVAGGMDQACSFLGSGTLKDGDIQDSMGTVEAISVSLASSDIQDLLFPDLLRGHYSINCHVLPGKYFVMAIVLSAGAILKWFKDTFLHGECREAARRGINVYELLLADSSPQPTPLLVLPHFTGTGTPEMNPLATGVILGLGLGTTRQDIVKGIFQGIGHEIAINLDFLDAIGVSLRDLRCVGGGSNSRYWLQMKADMLKRPIRTLQDNEVAGLGAAILAGVGAGVWDSFEEATRCMVTTDTDFVPEKTYHHFYEAQYQLYQTLYPAIRDMLPKFQGLSIEQFAVQ